MKRRLAAILAADMVGYSRRVRSDEEGTIAALKDLHANLIDPAIANHNGRVFKVMGDGMLVEFASVVDAVRGAIEFQQALSDRNRGVAPERQTALRVGINLGDVVIDGDDIKGDGVNIAARLEGLAEPGGICISDAVHEQVRDRLAERFADMGERTVKNIERPVKVWRWASPVTEPTAPTTPAPLRNKPFIAVLAFDNMSDDPAQEYFSDGITEDLITALSHVGGFFVIARNSTFTYKGVAAQAKQVGAALGARYVIEGSVRKAGGRVRITVQLIDTENDSHLWAEHYDRDIGDIFAVQDEITRTIVGAIEPELGEAEYQRARLKPPENLDAWDCHNRAAWHFLKITRDDFAQGFRLLEQATALDPTFARASGLMATAQHGAVLLGYSDDPKVSIRTAIKAGWQAIALDDKDAHNHFGLGRAYTLSGDIEGAIVHFELALAINPSFALAHHGLVTALSLVGRHEDALRHAEMALRLSPRDPMTWTFLQVKAHALYHLKRDEEAVATAERATRYPGAAFWCWTVLAAALANLAQINRAKAAIAEALEHNPDLSLNFFRTALPWRETGDLEHYLDGLRKAGLSET